jgi:hypothetical protein
MLMLAAALPDIEESASPFATALVEAESWTIRGQDAVTLPTTVIPSGPVTTYYQAPGATDPFGMQPYGTPYQAQPGMMGAPGQMQGDPWSGGVSPYAVPQGFYGVNGPQPHQFGVRNLVDATFMPDGKVGFPGGGDLSILAIDTESRLTMPLGPTGWVFQMAPQYGYRSWEGPTSAVGPPALPGSAHRIGLDMVLQTPSVGGWSWEFAFNPAVATDFRDFSENSVFYDGRIVAYWTVAPTWTWVLGAQYWDRVDNIVIPYAGAIWTPDPLWEFQLIFPKPKVSVFLGTPLGIATWLYVTGGYHVEAFDLRPIAGADSNRVQFTDWRVLGGFRWDTGWVQSFAEAGYVFERDVEWDRGAGKYGVDGGFIGRVGIRF